MQCPGPTQGAAWPDRYSRKRSLVWGAHSDVFDLFWPLSPLVAVMRRNAFGPEPYFDPLEEVGGGGGGTGEEERGGEGRGGGKMGGGEVPRLEQDTWLEDSQPRIAPGRLLAARNGLVGPFKAPRGLIQGNRRAGVGKKSVQLPPPAALIDPHACGVNCSPAIRKAQPPAIRRRSTQIRHRHANSLPQGVPPFCSLRKEGRGLVPHLTGSARADRASRVALMRSGD